MQQTKNKFKILICIQVFDKAENIPNIKALLEALK